MKISCNELLALGGLLKTAQEQKRMPPKSRKKRITLSPAYPAYGRAMLTQFDEDPAVAGGKRALTMGALGTVLGALAARIMTKNPLAVAGGGIAGGGLGALAGYHSGEQESVSERSKLLFLRRLGITRPGELDVLLQNQPEASKRVMQEGVII